MAGGSFVVSGTGWKGGDRPGRCGGCPGGTWTPPFLLQIPGKGALTHHPQAVGATACGSRAFDQGGPSGCAQLHGGAVVAPLFLCRANPESPFSSCLTGAAPARFHFAGQCSVRETNAQPAPATWLFKGFGTLSQQAKTDFRRTRRKSVLSICGNKCPACHFGGCPNKVECRLILCYTLKMSIRQIGICKFEGRFL